LRRFTAACQRWSLFVNLGAGSVPQKCTHANVLPFPCVQLCFQYNQASPYREIVTRDCIRTCVLAHQHCSSWMRSFPPASRQHSHTNTKLMRHDASMYKSVLCGLWEVLYLRSFMIHMTFMCYLCSKDANHIAPWKSLCTNRPQAQLPLLSSQGQQVE
jgi:hypothetical protein